MYKIWFWKPLCDLNNPSFVLKLNCRNIRGFWLCATWRQQRIGLRLRGTAENTTQIWPLWGMTLTRTKIANLRPAGQYSWIGLYRDPQIYWSDGSNYSFSSWYWGRHPLGSMKVVCGVADLKKGGNWRLISCEERKPFVCYSITSENLFLYFCVAYYLFVSFLTGLIKLYWRQHAAQRPEVPHSVF